MNKRMSWNEINCHSCVCASPIPYFKKHSHGEMQTGNGIKHDDYSFRSVFFFYCIFHSLRASHWKQQMKWVFVIALAMATETGEYKLYTLFSRERAYTHTKWLIQVLDINGMAEIDAYSISIIFNFKSSFLGLYLRRCCNEINAKSSQ